MARYIDADELRRRIKEKTNPYGKPTLDYESGVKVLNMIDNAPTADVVPKSEVASEICSLLEDYLSHMTETTSNELKKAQEECIVGSIIACNSYQLILNSMNLLVKGIKNKYGVGK